MKNVSISERKLCFVIRRFVFLLLIIVTLQAVAPAATSAEAAVALDADTQADANADMALDQNASSDAVLDVNTGISINILVPPIWDFDSIGEFYNGFARVVKDEKIGVIDLTGKIIVPLEYDEIGIFQNGYAKVGIGDYENRKYGYVDINGKVVIPVLYDELKLYIKDELVWVSKDGKQGYVDMAGKIVVPIEYDKANIFTRRSSDIIKADIEPLRSLVNLQYLNIWNNQITNIAPLEKLTNLTSLYINDNHINDISPISSLIKLSDLDIGHNLIYNITPLRTLTYLTALSIQNNYINDIRLLKPLINLEVLFLGNNLLTEIELDYLHSVLPECDILLKDYEPIAAEDTATTETTTLTAEFYTNIVYEANVANPSLTDMNKAMSIIKGKLDAQDLFGYDIYCEDDNRLVVSLPSYLEYDINYLANYLINITKLTFVDEDGNELLSGSDVADASYAKQDGAYVVDIYFTDQGALKFADATQNNIDKSISIYLDDKLLAMPKVQLAITSGEAIIAGNYTLESASILASQIQSATFPLELFIVDIY